MKKYFILISLSLIFSSCLFEPYPCAVKVVNFKLYPVVKHKTAEKSTIKGWYHSEFQNDNINLAVEFGYTYCEGHYDQFKEYYAENHPIEKTIIITCNKNITNDIDTIKSGESLNDLFRITEYRNPVRDYYISYLISEKDSTDYHFNEQYYTFNVTLLTSDSISLHDSCIIRNE